MTYDVSEQVEISFSIVQEVGRLAEMSIQGSVKPDSANLLEDAWYSVGSETFLDQLEIQMFEF